MRSLRLIASSLTLALLSCHPITLLVYEVKPAGVPADSKDEVKKNPDWDFTEFSKTTSLIADRNCNGLKIEIIITRKGALEEVAMRMSDRREPGTIDVLPVRISVFNEGRKPVDVDFSKIRLKTGSGQILAPIDIRSYQKYADASRLPYEWTFGQRTSFLFQQPLPDYVRFAELDTAAPNEKALREKQRLEAFKPVSGTIIDRGLRMLSWIIFPLPTTGEDYSLVLPAGLDAPEMKFKVNMVKRPYEIISFDDSEDEVNRRLAADRESIAFDNEELFTMHRQHRKHSELRKAIELTEEKEKK